MAVVTRAVAGPSHARSGWWLVAELNACVATELSASLFIGDATVPLSSDGTFWVQVPCRDGEQERSLRLELQRTTPKAQVNSKGEALVEWF